MPDRPASLSEVAGVADRALGALDGDGTVDVLWERTLADGRAEERLLVAVTAVQDGRAARVETADGDDVALQRAAKAAVLRARQARAWPAPPLPAPAPGRPHDGFEPALGAMDPAVALARAREAAGDGLSVSWGAGVARMAVASSTGVRVSEQRSHVVVRVEGERPGGRRAAVVAAGVGEPDVAAAAREVRALLGEGPAAGPFAPNVPGGEPLAPDEALAGGPLTVVLGPQAVATVLDALRPAVGVEAALGGGPLAGRRATRVAAPAVNLSDSARYPLTLPRSYDAEGVPRRPVPLIQDGVAHGRVHDSASAARAGGGATSTGHATRAATLAPFPDHLVLVGGGADGMAELCGAGGVRVMVPALSETHNAGARGRRHITVGAALVRDGAIAGSLPALTVDVDALEVLASVEALTSRQRLVPLRGGCPGGLGAAVVPALRAGGGVRVVR